MLATGSPESPEEPVAVRLFGGTRVVPAGSGPGDGVQPPAGTPAALLRLVAVRGSLHVEEVCDALWPDSPPGAGRARLRNVLSRLRAACGAVVVRDGETVALAPGVQVDVAVFEATARTALALPAGSPERVTTAKRALALHDGDLLPEDLYREWAAAPRERARGLRLALLDAVAEDAAAAGDVTGALRRWEEACRIEPYDEVRYVAMARLLLAHGRSGAAHAVLERADATLAALSLPPSPALLEVRQAMERGRLDPPERGPAG
jgi:DNA-binding SARP family transcriptional activator